MVEKTCERCGAYPSGDFGLLDYCAECSADLCDKCMAEGCCGHIPARSGSEEDDDDQDDLDALCRACFGPLSSEEAALAQRMVAEWEEERGWPSDRKQAREDDRRKFREEC